MSAEFTFDTIVDPEGKPIPWAQAAARSRGAFRQPPQRSELAAHEHGAVSELEDELRDEVRVLMRRFVTEKGLPGGRARTAVLVGGAVESMALRQAAENARKKHLMTPKKDDDDRDE